MQIVNLKLKWYKFGKAQIDKDDGYSLSVETLSNSRLETAVSVDGTQ